MKPKVLAIVGPTATGKTRLALTVCRKYSGEILSADSRQVFRGMDIGTGKDLPSGAVLDSYSLPCQEFGRILPYLFGKTRLWLYDLVDFSTSINAVKYSVCAGTVLDDCLRRGFLPVITGGTGLYIRALTEGIGTGGIPPDGDFRQEACNYDLDKLQELLRNESPETFAKLNDSDRKNSRRLIRKIEIVRYRSLCLPESDDGKNCSKPDYDLLKIGLTAPNGWIYRMIDRRVEERLRNGIVNEIGSLLEKGADWTSQAMTGIGYREWREYFNNRQQRPDLARIITEWKYHEHAYARRQLTWFKKDAGIIWYDVSVTGWENEALRAIGSWYNK